jgi:hypothetical protein
MMNTDLYTNPAYSFYFLYHFIKVLSKKIPQNCEGSKILFKNYNLFLPIVDKKICWQI